MTHEPIDEINDASTEQKAPPLCLMHYFAERTEAPPGRRIHPPGTRAWIAERRGNLIILEFADPPEPAPRQRSLHKSLLARFCDGLFLLLLLASLLGCIAAFRF